MNVSKLRRLVFWFLLILFVYYSVVFGQGAPPITVDVLPRVAAINRYQKQVFRMRYQIEPHKDNRQYAISYTCGSELHSSQGEVDGDKHPRTTTIYPELTVIDDCDFMACVVRIVEAKPKTICVWAKVVVPEEANDEVHP